MDNEGKREVIFCVLNILFALAIGALIYACLGPDTILGRWLCWLSIEREINSELRAFLRNWGCDFLWAYALFFSLFIVNGSRTKSLLPSCEVAGITAVAVEASQLVEINGVAWGTFDLLDILIELSAICVGAALLRCRRYYNRKRERGKSCEQ